MNEVDSSPEILSRALVINAFALCIKMSRHAGLPKLIREPPGTWVQPRMPIAMFSSRDPVQRPNSLPRRENAASCSRAAAAAPARSPECRLRRGTETCAPWSLAERNQGDGQRCGLILKSWIYVASDLAAGRLVPVLPEWETEPAPVCALFPRQRQMPTRLRLFLETLAAHLGDFVRANQTRRAE